MSIEINKYFYICFTSIARKYMRLLYFLRALWYTRHMIVILLWQVRTRRGLSLRELAERTQLSKSTLNRIENGKTSPTLDELEVIAGALNCTITDLYAVINQ